MARIDFRVQTGFFRHPKTISLREACGEHAVLCLLQLWAHAAENAQDGNLDAMSDANIEKAAGWHGQACEKGKFVEQLRHPDSLFLDGKQIHDWQEHQPFLAGSKERSRKARHAARMRWACSDDAKTEKGNTPLPSSPLPTLPSPLRKDIVERSPDHKEAVEYFCTKYQAKVGTSYLFQGGKDGTIIKAFLKTWGLEKFKTLTDQFFSSTDPFITGKAGYTLGVMKACANKLNQGVRNVSRSTPSDFDGPSGEQDM
jgi:type II secretory pathway pseudopilin PulG